MPKSVQPSEPFANGVPRREGLSHEFTAANAMDTDVGVIRELIER
jgi:hypothetical protein